MYKKDNLTIALEKYALSIEIISILGDVRDQTRLSQVCDSFKVQTIYHSAAYKHVPILERNAREAIKNNILGTKIVADAASEYNCQRFMLISTDKAVNPTNILGASKRIAELYIENINQRSSTNFSTVRFGNVLDSDGSVVPLFRKQILSGGPITVTHPDITRYFMTIEEACQLILQASKIATGGEIFILDMGVPIKINYLAEQMIRLSGLVPNKDIAIQFSGLRSGEKLYEELFYENEKIENTSHKKILLAKHQVLNHNEVSSKISKILHACDSFDVIEIKKFLNELVPFFNDNQDNIININKKKNEKSN